MRKVQLSIGLCGQDGMGQWLQALDCLVHVTTWANCDQEFGGDNPDPVKRVSLQFLRLLAGHQCCLHCLSRTPLIVRPEPQHQDSAHCEQPGAEQVDAAQAYPGQQRIGRRWPDGAADVASRVQ